MFISILLAAVNSAPTGNWMSKRGTEGLSEAGMVRPVRSGTVWPAPNSMDRGRRNLSDFVKMYLSGAI